MRLSEVILLGSTVVTPKAGALRFSGENAGCALGMAVIASGGRFQRATRQIAATERRTLNVEAVWGAWLLRQVARPCDCRVPLTLDRLRLKEITAYLFDRDSCPLPRGMRIKDIIAHLFDHHVMGKRNWTLDQLLGWLESWEPSELAQNTFIYDVSLKSLSPPQSHGLSDDRVEWQKTCEAFEAKVNAKRRRGPSARRT